VRAITDSSGAVVAHYEYSAWGEVLSSSSEFAGGLAAATFVGSLGVRFDSTTGLHYMRHRWYDARLGRFLSRDVLGGINRYEYCYGNPVNWVDVDGLRPEETWDSRSWGPTTAAERAEYDAVRAELSGHASIAIGATLFEPADWAATGYDIYSEGFHPGMLLGALAPFASYAAYRRLQHLFDFTPNLSNIDIEPRYLECPSAADNLSPFVVQPGSEQIVPWPRNIYRGGGKSPSNLSIRSDRGETGVSFRDSLTNPIDQNILGNKEYVNIDTSKLPPGSVFLDGGVGGAPGHVSVFASPETIQAAATKSRFPR
jgi:RHS repeat-associated protein